VYRAAFYYARACRFFGVFSVYSHTVHRHSDIVGIMRAFPFVAAEGYLQNAARRQSVYRAECQLPQKMLRREFFDCGHILTENLFLVYDRVILDCNHIFAFRVVLPDAERRVQASRSLQRRKRLDGVIDAYNSELRRHDGKAENRPYGACGKNEYHARKFIHFEKLQGQSNPVLNTGGNL
jgi:hypothetical protein